MALIDTNNESNRDADLFIEDGGASQSFSVASNTEITQASFLLSKQSSPTGNAVAKLYAITGTHGTDAKPTGSALATSDTVDVSTLTTTPTITDFTFSTTYEMQGGTKYAIAVEYADGAFPNRLLIGYDNGGGSHDGNFATFNGSTWTDGSSDTIFYVYGDIVASDTKNPLFMGGGI